MLFFLISQCNLVCFACLIKINNFQKCLGLGIWLISERQKSKLNTHTNGNQSKSIILNFDTYHLRRTFVILKDINRGAEREGWNREYIFGCYLVDSFGCNIYYYFFFYQTRNKYGLYYVGVI